jgi:hypothetical protein
MRSPSPATEPNDSTAAWRRPLAGALLRAEIDLRTGARLVEWAAVQRPDLERTARFAFAAAQRVRGDRLEAAG